MTNHTLSGTSASGGDALGPPVIHAVLRRAPTQRPPECAHPAHDAPPPPRTRRTDERDDQDRGEDDDPGAAACLAPLESKSRIPNEMPDSVAEVIGERDQTEREQHLEERMRQEQHSARIGRRTPGNRRDPVHEQQETAG